MIKQPKGFSLFAGKALSFISVLLVIALLSCQREKGQSIATVNLAATIYYDCSEPRFASSHLNHMGPLLTSVTT